MYDSSIYLLVALTGMTNLIYGLAAPFLPTMLNDRGVAETWTGLIFAIYAVSSMVTSLFVGKTIGNNRHRKMITCGTILMGISIAGFGLVYKV